jgi:hypothetical protein
MVEGYVKPANQIIADLEGLVVHEYTIGANATPAKMEAGDEADLPLGILDVADDMLLTDTYAVGEPCRVIERGKCLVRMPAGGTASAVGKGLVTNANGLLVVQAVGLIGAQGAPFAYALEINAHAAESLVLAFVTGQREAA